MAYENLIGKTILIGAQWGDAERDEDVRIRQMFGTIERVDDDGIHVRLRDDELFVLPPYPGALQQAEPGEYTLSTTLEIVHDPDYLVVWTFTS
jgi:hypothetical protein